MTRNLLPNVLALTALARTLAATCLLAASVSCLAADPDIKSGQEIFQREWAYQAPPKLQQGEQSRFEFERQLKALPGDGLGPMFNATSCEACHAAGGASGVQHNVTLITLDPRSPILKAANAEELKIAKSSLLELYPGLISPSGALSMDVVVHEASARPLFDLVRDQIREMVPGGITDEWYRSESRSSDAIAERPVIAGRAGLIDFYLSQRNSPPLFGLGVIDRIEISTMLRIARQQQRRSGGKISGRLGAGKFGWRGQTPSLDAFVRGACAGEVGLQLAGTPQPGDVADETYVSLGTDLSERQVLQLVSFVRALPYPRQETKIAEEATLLREGKKIFAKIGCADCHVENVYPARGLYSDLLLHDMGSLLQAPSPASIGSLTVQPMRIPFFRPDTPPLGAGNSIGAYYGGGPTIPTPYAFDRPAEPTFPYGKLPAAALHPNQITVSWDALQREWRTPPLWGVADSAPYLHDGRAETLDSAIRWHAGEVQDSVALYRSLPAEKREQLIDFLKSLRSPPTPHRQQQERMAAKQEKHRPLSIVSTPTEEVYENGSLEEALQVFRESY